MAVSKYLVALKQSEVQTLGGIIKKGVHSAREHTRARVLLMANENGPGKTDAEIVESLGVSINTPHEIRKRYSQGGLERALYDAPRPGTGKVISVEAKAKLVAIACTDAPEGYDNWTMSLLAEEISKEGYQVGRTSVYNILLENELRPWEKKDVVYTEID